MKRFKYHLKENAVNSHHFTFGRASPLHNEHANLGFHVKKQADDEGAGHTVVLSGKSGDIENPLTPEQKLKHAKRAMPGVNVVVADKSAPTFLHHIAKLHQDGVNNLTVHVGSDRVDEFRNTLGKYNGTHDKALFNFDNINVVPYGAERTEGDKKKKKEEQPLPGAPKKESLDPASFSASRMRAYAALANQNTPEGINARKMFHAMAPKSMSPEHKDEMLRDTQAGLAAAAIPKPRNKRAVNESTTTADVAGIIDDDGGFDAMPDDVNAGFADMVNNMADMSAMKFDQTYDPEARSSSKIEKSIKSLINKGKSSVRSGPPAPFRKKKKD